MGPTKPSEQFFFRGLWGWASTVWERLHSTGGKLHTVLHGYDGSAWHKLGYVWGYNDIWRDYQTHTKVGAGNYDLSTAAVPAGYVYVLTSFTCRDWATAVTQQFYVFTGGVGHILDNSLLVPANQVTVCGASGVVLKEGDSLTVRFFAAQNGDTLQMYVTGYKMRLGM